MSLFDKLRKKKPDPVPVQEEEYGPTLAGIPAHDEQWFGSNDENRTVGITPDQDAFINPPPHNQAGGWAQTYPLVFFLMEENVCTRKIDYTCYGYEHPDDILRRMMYDGLLPRKQNFAYRILYWPTRNGMSTVEHFDDSSPKMLQDFNPRPGKVLIIEQYRKITEPMPMHTLYGCPTAALPEQESALNNPCVDILWFD